MTARDQMRAMLDQLMGSDQGMSMVNEDGIVVELFSRTSLSSMKRCERKAKVRF